MSDWKSALKTFENGLTVAVLTETCNDTASTVRNYAPLMDRQITYANLLVREKPRITVLELRQQLPELSLWTGDHHLTFIIQSGGYANPRETTNTLFADAASAAGYRLSADTIDWYRGHGSRQIKATERGRPRKK